MSSVVVRPEVDLATLLTNRELRVRLLDPSGQYVGSSREGGLSVDLVEPGDPQSFRLIPEVQVALCTHEGRYVCAERGGGGEVVGDRSVPLEWELFDLVPAAPGRVALRAANGQYLSAEPDGRVTADRDRVREWETFERIDRGPNRLALRTAHGKYLCVEPGGRVIADRDQVGPWETFFALESPRPPVRLRTGTGFLGIDRRELVLNAKAASAHEAEAFRIVPFGEDRIALRAADGRFVCAEGGGGGRLIADREVPREWETFTRIPGVEPESFTLRAHDGHSIGVAPSGALRADRVADAEALVLHTRPEDTIPLYLAASNGLYVGAEVRIGAAELIADLPIPRLGEIALTRAPASAGRYHLGVARRWVTVSNRRLLATDDRANAISFALEAI